MNRKAVRNSRSEKNEDFFQRKQLFNTKLLLFFQRVAERAELWRLRHGFLEAEPFEQFSRCSFDGDVPQYFDSIEHSLHDCSDGWKNLRRFPKE